jgi:hypothetical protein
LHLAPINGQHRERRQEVGIYLPDGFRWRAVIIKRETKRELFVGSKEVGTFLVENGFVIVPPRLAPTMTAATHRPNFG